MTWDADAYKARGFVTINGFLSRSEVDTCNGELARLWKDVDAAEDQDWVQWRDHDVLGRVPDRLDPVTTKSQVFDEIARGGRLLELAAMGLGGPAVLFKDKAIMKWPGTHGYLPHQDYASWEPLGVPADHILTIMILFDAADRENGALLVWPGMHDRKFPPSPADPTEIDPADLDDADSAAFEGRAGDAMMFHSLVPHRSGPNGSHRPRRSYFLVYIRAEHAERVARGDGSWRKAAFRRLTKQVG